MFNPVSKARYELKWMFHLSNRVSLYGNGMFSLRLGNTPRWLHRDLVQLKIGEKVSINLVELRTYFLDDILETFALDNSDYQLPGKKNLFLEQREEYEITLR